MIIRKVDANHDWEFGRGLSSYNSAEDAINENIQTRLLSWKNDAFFALDQGVDWRNRLDKGQQEPLIQELQGVIMSSFGVVGINDFDAIFDSSTRLIRITYNIDTIYSPSYESQINSLSGEN